MKHIKRHRILANSIVESSITTESSSSGDWVITSVQPCLARSSSYLGSEMEDVKASGPWEYHDCSHTLCKANYGVPVLELGERTPNLRYLTSLTSLANRVTIPCGKIFSDLYSQYGSSYGDVFPLERVEKWLADDSLDTIITIDRDPFDSDFSIWFLLVDIIGIPKLITSIFSREIIRRNELFSRKTAAQLANDDLAVKFGFLATYRDLVDFVGICNRFRRGFDEYVKADKVYRWHAPPFQEDCSAKIPIVPNAFRSCSTLGNGNVIVERRTTPISCRFTRTMAYRFTCPELKSWLSRFKQLIDLFGVLDPAALWDVIPFSFVVDWFLDIGRWLHKHKPRLFSGAVLVKDYCESMKVSYVNEYFVSPTEGFYPLDYAYSIGVEERSTYLRRRYQPDVGHIERGTGHSLLSMRQAIIAAGLVAQRVPRPGSIGDLFDGVDFGLDHIPINGTTAAETHEANKAWATRQHQLRAARGGLNLSLRKFELVSAESRRRRADLERLARLPRSSRPLALRVASIKNRRTQDLRVIAGLGFRR